MQSLMVRLKYCSRMVDALNSEPRRYGLSEADVARIWMRATQKILKEQKDAEEVSLRAYCRARDRFCRKTMNWRCSGTCVESSPMERQCFYKLHDLLGLDLQQYSPVVMRGGRFKGLPGRPSAFRGVVIVVGQGQMEKEWSRLVQELWQVAKRHDTFFLVDGLTHEEFAELQLEGVHRMERIAHKSKRRKTEERGR
jgi:hypothetical protein